MKISNVKAFNVAIPLDKPVSNQLFSFKDSEYTIVIIETDVGIIGWSYVFGMLHTKSFVEELAQLLIGEEVDTRYIWEKLFKTQLIRYDRGGIAMRAISAIDIALWDIKGKAANMPIYKLLGGYRKQARVYYSGGLYPPHYSNRRELLDCLDEDLGRGIDKGFDAFKVKIGRETPDVDLERIAHMREIIGDDAELMIDCFCAYRPETIIPLAHKLEEYNISFLEEPTTLDDIEAMAKVAANINIPVAAGESQYTLQQFKNILELHAVGILQTDVTYAGGITSFIEYAAMAKYFGLKMVPHGPHDLSLQMALAIPEVVNMEYMDANSSLFLIHRILENPIVAENGIVKPNNLPGHGIILDMHMAEKYKCS